MRGQEALVQHMRLHTYTLADRIRMLHFIYFGGEVWTRVWSKTAIRKMDLPTPIKETLDSSQLQRAKHTNTLPNDMNASVLVVLPIH